MTEWNLILNEIFPNGIPSFCKWTEKLEIIELLNRLGSFKDSNHLFYADGGGMDLDGATESYEKNCIEINTGTPEILSPKKLTFHSFPNLEWAYFRIELNQLNQTKVYNYELEFEEELCEIEPLNYIALEHWDLQEYNNEQLPKNARLVKRKLKGSFIIVGKESPYNRRSSTYDGRHYFYNDEEFRIYIETVQRNGWDK